MKAAFLSRRVVTPEGIRDAAVIVEHETIAAIVGRDDLPAGVPVRDFGDSVLMAGLVDTHVHVNEPGRTEWEGYNTATRAAAYGGITTIVDMPLNCIPVTTTLAALHTKLEVVRLHVDCGFWGGVIPGNASELDRMIDAGVLGFKAFLVHSGIDEFPNATEKDLREAMPILARRGVPLLVHAELGEHLHESPAGGPEHYSTYLASRPHAAEDEAIRFIIGLCRETKCRVHIVHLSSADALPMIAAAKTEGLPLTVETCPHYLSLAAEEVPDGSTEYKCAPPIREKDNRDRLWQGLKDGIIDFVVSDHSPCTPHLKLRESGDFMRAWGGISSVQLTLPVVWTAAKERSIGLDQIARWMCQVPARFAGLDHWKGSIAPGKDADFVVWDPEATFTVDPTKLHTRHKLTPYAGRELHGVVRETILRGQSLLSEPSALSQHLGEPLRPILDD